jgi:hypothetical protein
MHCHYCERALDKIIKPLQDNLKRLQNANLKTENLNYCSLTNAEENLTVCDYLLAMLIFDFKQIVFGTYILMIVTTAKH